MEPDVPASQALLSARGVSRGFGEGLTRVEVFSGVSLDLLPGDLLSIVGPSGSGKSTLLHLFAGLDDPDSGEVHVQGVSWTSLSPEERARRRGAAIGFVFGSAHLLIGSRLRRFREWARAFAIVLSVVDLFLIPFGTALGLYALWALIHERSKPLFEQDLPAVPRVEP